MTIVKRTARAPQLLVTMMLLVLGCFGQPRAANADEATPLNVIPTPRSVEHQAGAMTLRGNARIVALSPELLPLAQILADDISRLHGVDAPNAVVGQARNGDIVLRLVRDDAFASAPDAYRVDVDRNAVVEAGNYNAVAFGMMTLLQAMEAAPGGLAIPRMRVEDDADRAFRGLQVSIRAGYHSPEWVKRVIDLMRFYKVRILQLHTTQMLWVGATMASSNDTDPALLRQNAAWSQREMDDVIAYAKARGVLMLPHNEMRPNDPYWRRTLMEDFTPDDRFAGYMDEVDGRGAYVVQGDPADDERFWNFLKVVTQRSYEQFAQGWPDGKLPYYHIGPVYGEGGCTGAQAVRMLGFLKEKNPDIKMMYWNGPSNNDADLAPHTDNLTVAFYSVYWGGTPDGLMGNGFEVVNVSWRPLYILPRTRRQAMKQRKWIFDEFHLARFGDHGTFGVPIEDVRDASAFQDRIVGSMLATWDFTGPHQLGGHANMILPSISSYAEHAWNVKPWPYPDEAWEVASAKADRLLPLAAAFLREARPSSEPGDVTATQGVVADAVDILWSESDNYPTHYQVYRATEPDATKAKPISDKLPASFVVQLNRFRDRNVRRGQKYYYWVRSINPHGMSPLGRAREGFTGADATVPAAHEPFNYAAGANLDKLDGGEGFGKGWWVEEFNAPVTVTPEGLTYPGLKTSGRALRLQATDSDESNGRRPPHTRIHRKLAQKYGAPGTELWSSYLIRANKVAVGDCRAHIGRHPIGKGWGSEFWFGGGPMKADETYFLVTRYTFHDGNDLVQMWINPTPGQRPADEDAVFFSRRENNQVNDLYDIFMQPYGEGSYDIDEIRIGATYEVVAPTK